MASSSTDTPLCPDWVFSVNSNVHMANDRRWFTSYTAFESIAGSYFPPDTAIRVAGVGTVVLPVKKSPNRKGPSAHGQLVLQDVLHCPEALCNIVGLPTEWMGCTVSFGGCGKSKGYIRDRQGTTMAYFDPNLPMLEIKLSGPPVGPVVGPSVLKEKVCAINLQWSESEQQRWETFKQSRGESTKSTAENVPKNTKAHHQSPQDSSSAPYSKKEKKWLEENYGGEYRFFIQHGLSIYKEEDREEGRDLIRALIFVESKDDMDTMQDDEADLDGHMADYYFDEESLDWIEKHYRNSKNFMFSYGLKFYDDEDCRKAQKLVDQLMTRGD